MEWVRRENAEQRGQRSCRLSIGDGSWSVMAFANAPPASERLAFALHDLGEARWNCVYFAYLID